MIRVLVVEDSVTQREILRRLFAGDGELTVVAEARNGKEAIERVQECTPDVVLMDIHMPDMDGITATREIMARFPVPIVIASATLRRRDIDLAMKAYEAGAVSVIEKPEGAVLLHLHKIGPQLRNELIAASKAKIVRRVSTPDRFGGGALKAPPRVAGIRAVGICASTGGPPVLLDIFRNIPNPFPLPILLVQHISYGFEEGFARWLADASGQPVDLAVNGQRLEGGIHLAPGGSHLVLSGSTRCELMPGSENDLHCPSGNPLFASLAAHLGSQALGILLTGMGEDGADGLLSLKRAGGTTVIQAEVSCLIWGMPRVAQSKGAAQYELNPGEIAELLTRAARREH